MRAGTTAGRVRPGSCCPGRGRHPDPVGDLDVVGALAVVVAACASAGVAEVVLAHRLKSSANESIRPRDVSGDSAVPLSRSDARCVRSTTADRPAALESNVNRSARCPAPSAPLIPPVLLPDVAPAGSGANRLKGLTHSAVKPFSRPVDKQTRTFTGPVVHCYSCRRDQEHAARSRRAPPYPARRARRSEHRPGRHSGANLPTALRSARSKLPRSPAPTTPSKKAATPPSSTSTTWSPSPRHGTPAPLAGGAGEAAGAAPLHDLVSGAEQP